MKRRVIIIGLIVFTLWPLAHRALVARYETNPWKLFGWAMYCVPNPRTFLEVYEVKGERGIRLAAKGADFVDIGAFNFRRGILGRLVSQEDLARQILQRHPDFDGVCVVVYRYHLDWWTARLKWDRETTVHRKMGSRIQSYTL